MRRALTILIAGFLTAGIVTACIGPSGDTIAEKRRAAQDMRAETLDKLYQVQPAAREKIGLAEGYAVFSNVGVNVFFVSGGTGWGIARDNASGGDTYMKMGSAGLGLGIGVKDFRGVFVFTTRPALTNFVEHGWDASAQADLAAKAADKGGAWSGAVDVAPGTKLYQITENGLAVQVTVQGTKYWKDDELN